MARVLNPTDPDTSFRVHRLLRGQHKRNAADLCTQLVGRASIALRYAKYKGGNRWEQYSSNHVDKYAYEYETNKDEHGYEQAEAF